MKLTEHIAKELQDIVKDRVWDRSRTLREELMQRMETELRTLINEEVAKVLVTAAEVVITVDAVDGSLKIVDVKDIPASPVVETPAPPVTDTPAPVDPVVEVPVEVIPDVVPDHPVNPGRGGA